MQANMNTRVVKDKSWVSVVSLLPSQKRYILAEPGRLSRVSQTDKLGAGIPGGEKNMNPSVEVCENVARDGAAKS